jgi:hypothetical protein
MGSPRVEVLAVLPASAPIVQIRDTVAGHPGSTVLGSVSLSSHLPTNGWGSISFLTQNIVITAGEMYSIVVLPPSNSEGTVTLGVNGDPASYAGGALWVYRNGAWDINSYWEGDVQFRTYVETGPAIPAPGALILAGFVAWLRRRRTP